MQKWTRAGPKKVALKRPDNFKTFICQLFVSFLYIHWFDLKSKAASQMNYLFVVLKQE